MMRVGIGYDIHRLENGAQLVLGGTRIDAPFGAIGHSDADTLIHAVIDALLGASGLGDIGEHFPTTDPRYRGISSAKLLADIMALLHSSGWKVINIDAVVILEKPKLSPYRGEIRDTLARILHVAETAVNIKAKTKEGLGAVGSSRAVEAHAVALIRRTGGDESQSLESEAFWV